MKTQSEKEGNRKEECETKKEVVGNKERNKKRR